jgi:hypothetical protein
MKNIYNINNKTGVIIMNQKRNNYTATISKIAYNGTVCLAYVKNDGKMFRDHSWINKDDAGIEGVKALRNLRARDKVEFTAVPYKYANGRKTGLGDIRNVKAI